MFDPWFAIQFGSSSTWKWGARWWLAIAAVILSWDLPVAVADDRAIDFGRQVRPLLADRCFRCHGPDDQTREAGLRLDQRPAAIAPLDSGARAIVPGDSSSSELIRRVTSADVDERMPPQDAGPPLTDQQQRLLARWIDQGAVYQLHWSFVPPSRPAVPDVTTGQQDVESAIDRFVAGKLQEHRLSLSPEADRYSLIRRVTLDLTGLPPTLVQVDRFVHDNQPDAYQRLVDRLLASPQFGQRWARPWLDLARYADSAGYAQDPARTIWRYRDWVIQALNQNMPFDQFTIEQIAGDLLNDPTEDQLLATAFHRNTMTNSEGGTDDEEFRNAAVVDRVNTTMQAWMGLTMGCAQCHSHKYDPLTQEEYFGLFAIFNNTQDADRGDESPTLESFTPAIQRQRAELQHQIERLEQEIADSPTPIHWLAGRSGPIKTRFVRLELPAPKAFLHVAEVQAFAGEKNVALDGQATQSSVDYDGPPQLAIDGNTDGDYQSKSVVHTRQEDNPWWEVRLVSDEPIDRVVVWNRTDNGLQARLSPYRVVLLDDHRRPVWLEEDRLPPDPSREFAIPGRFEDVAGSVQRQLETYFAQQGGERTPQQVELDRLRKAVAELKGVATPIMRELSGEQRRQTRLQYRGNFLDQGPEVAPGVPAAFHPLPPSAAADRLGLARWLVDRSNPLTARVAVNRIWEQLFGVGLVETSEDFGTQGTPPTHPDLLDYLAIEFMESDWDCKRLIRQIVLSSTYRQSSGITPSLQQLDPHNRLLARGPRFRMSAETIRDQALCVAGLLSHRLDGPSVQPPRPVLGLKAAFGGSTDWQTSPGEDRYRRGIYTSWRRTTPYPSMTTFDAPSREFCTVRRIATNTPLQALVTLNDPVFVEAAQGLARRIVLEGGSDDASRATYGFRLCLARPPTDVEQQRLVQLYRQAYQRLQSVPDDAQRLASDPIGPPPESIDVVALAAWTVVSNVLLNLDEIIVKR